MEGFQSIRQQVTLQSERGSATSEYQDPNSQSIMTSLAGSFRKFKNKVQDGVKQWTHDLLGTPSDLYKPSVEELFREMEFISEWIQEYSSSPPSGGLKPA